MDTEISPPPTGPTDTLTPEPETSAPRSRWLNRLAIVAGLAALVLGPLAGGLFMYFSLTVRKVVDALSVTTIGVSMAALGAGIGSALARAGYEGTQGRPSQPFRPGIGWFWRCLAGLGLALGIGQALISFDLWAPVTFPLFHVLGVALPALAMLLLVGWGVKNNAPAPTQRQVVGQLALGTFGATAISFALEAVVAVIGVAAVGAVMALLPGGLEQLVELRALLADPTPLQDPQTLAHWLLKPGILLSVTIILVVIAPMIEEGSKSLGVPLLVLWTGRKPTLAQGWLWGFSVGTGFAITEGLFNGAANLSFWAGVALLRIGATAMHATTAALTGLGWARAFSSRPVRLRSPARPGPLASARQAWPVLGSYLASVTLHGLWNGMTVLIAISSLWTTVQPGAMDEMVVGGLVVTAGVIGLVVLTASTVGLAAVLTWRLSRG